MLKEARDGWRANEAVSGRDGGPEIVKLKFMLDADAYAHRTREVR